MNDFFRKFARMMSRAVGSPWAFIAGILSVMAMVIIGVIYSSHMNLAITLTVYPSAAAFLIVFLIQNTQNRQFESIQVKLDELLKVSKGDPNLIELEKLPEKQLQKLEKRIHDYREDQERKGRAEDVDKDGEEKEE